MSWKDVPSSVRVRDPELRVGWLEFAGEIRWDWFVTLTFDPKRVYPVNRQRAEREALGWCQDVARAYRSRVAWLVATERGHSGQWHAHTLLVGLSLDLSPLAKIWELRNGRVNVQRVRGSLETLLYVTKDAAISGDIVLSDTLTHYLQPCRKGPSRE